MKPAAPTTPPLAALLFLFALVPDALPQPCPPQPTFDLGNLDGKIGYVLRNAEGSSLAIVGDVNGDGHGDYISGDLEGNQAYLVFGGPAVGATGAFDASSINGLNGKVLLGNPSGEHAGFSAAPAGDFNNDGAPDLVIGAPTADYPGKTDAGRVYVLYGGATLGAAKNISLSTLDGTNGFAIQGANTEDMLGYDVAGGADLNLDGIDDIVLGASRADPGGVNAAGMTYVLFGGQGTGASGVFSIAGLTASQGVAINGSDPYGFSGLSVAVIGDLNADGAADVAIGAPMNQNPVGPGKAYVVFGKAGLGAAGAIELNALNGYDGFLVSGAQTGDWLGDSVAPAGDFNGDGMADLAVGAENSDFSGTDAGQVAVIYGSPTIGSSGVLLLQHLDGVSGVCLDGPIPQDSAGRGLWTAGDLNRDGFDDLLIGARDADGSGLVNSGMVYLVYGGVPSALGGHFDLGAIDGTNGKFIPGLEAQEYLGNVITGGGDVNGDGHPDFLLRSNEVVYVVFDAVTPAPLMVDTEQISLSAGGTQNFCLQAGAGQAGMAYLILGSMTGIAPPTILQGFKIPLIWDAYFSFLVSFPNSFFFPNQFGILDAQGSGTASYNLVGPINANFVGLKLHHAFVAFTPAQGALTFASNDTLLELVP
ncbi:MAG: FG-GAP repeat protein [Planctomycetes bacterium]|nr:FG-GAP repeat protein [Planctomycetota bacterium]